MRKLYGAAIVVAAIGLAGAADAQQNQVDGVNIVYPIDGIFLFTFDTNG